MQNTGTPMPGAPMPGVPMPGVPMPHGAPMGFQAPMQDASIHTDVLSFDAMLGTGGNSNNNQNHSAGSSAANLAHSGLVVVDPNQPVHRVSSRGSLSRSSSKSGSRRSSRHSSRSRSGSRSRSNSRSSTKQRKSSKHNRGEPEQPQKPPTLMPMPTDDDVEDVEDFFASLTVSTKPAVLSSSSKDKKKQRTKKSSQKDERKSRSKSSKSKESSSSKSKSKENHDKSLRSSRRRGSGGTLERRGSGAPLDKPLERQESSRRRGIEAAADTLANPNRRRLSISNKDTPMMDCSSANQSHQSTAHRSLPGRTPEPKGRRTSIAQRRASMTDRRTSRKHAAAEQLAAEETEAELAAALAEAALTPTSRRSVRGKHRLNRNGSIEGARRSSSIRIKNNSKRQLLVDDQKTSNKTLSTETSGSSSEQQHQDTSDNNHHAHTKLAPSRRDRNKVTTARSRIRRYASERTMESRKSAMTKGSLRRGLGRCKSEPTEALHDIMFVDIDDCTVIADIYDDNDDDDDDEGVSPSPKSVRQLQAKAKKMQQTHQAAKAAKNSLLLKSNKPTSARNIMK
ncbi:expressed unknown protein [Seminavis robusta]|uniref:Uncharacterized protein n=1 Tax=Seminavis robusta TaxID=568900 RepID=A0A9N8HT28_9STRA|nr:expressed unknown protein [Seminavis robusta]|eukprot:Sro1458_g274450.1 n/a (566) ;mRNA; r:21285-23090